jgi:hypothetical protein
VRELLELPALEPASKSEASATEQNQ